MTGQFPTAVSARRGRPELRLNIFGQAVLLSHIAGLQTNVHPSSMAAYLYRSARKLSENARPILSNVCRVGHLQSLFLSTFNNGFTDTQALLNADAPHSSLETFPLRFTVKRQQPILVTPAKPTPNHVLTLSNIDDQLSLRIQVPIVQFYARNPSRGGQDPRKVIKNGLEKLLVHYYPFAGRVRDAEDGKLCVHCTAEGILFTEAEADVRLSDFGDLKPPFPCCEEILYQVPGSQSITHTPPLLVQVTTLKCGGFIFALRLNHTLSDAVGIVQFMTALGETCHGASTPSVKPVWGRRKLLSPRNPPQVSVQPDEYQKLDEDILSKRAAGNTFRSSEMSHESFVFGRKEITLLKSQAGGAGHQFSTFEVVSACVWRARTRSLNFDPHQTVRLMFALDGRNRLSPPLPKGYYGNVIFAGSARSTAEQICKASLGEVALLIRRAKEAMDEEHLRSVIDMMELNRRVWLNPEGMFMISDLRKAGFEDVELGWGKAVYGGTAHEGAEIIQNSSVMIRGCSGEGLKGGSVVVPMYLPCIAMEKFRDELNQVLSS